MFPRRYFGRRYFAPRYFPQSRGDAPSAPAVPPALPGGAWTARDPGRGWTSADSPRAWTVPDPGRTWTVSTQPKTLRKKAGASRTYDVDFTQYGELRAGEDLTGTPTTSVSPSSGGPTCSGHTTSGNKVRFRIAGGTAGVTYTITVTVSTDGGNTLQEDVLLEVY